MVPKQILLVAGDTENDQLAAHLVRALREDLAKVETGYSEEEEQPLHASLEPRFFGAGGPYMDAAGVELAFDATHLQSIRPKFIRLLRFRRAFGELYRLAIEREPHVLVGVGFFGFNLRLAQAIKHYVHRESGTFHNWEPRFIQITAPERWAARAARVERLSRNIDCLLSTSAKENEWYTTHAPELHVEFLGEARDLSIAELARRAADAISREVLQEEAHFPLRAYLWQPQR